MGNFVEEQQEKAINNDIHESYEVTAFPDTTTIEVTSTADTSAYFLDTGYILLYKKQHSRWFYMCKRLFNQISKSMKQVVYRCNQIMRKG